MDPPLHLWARKLPLEERPARGYAACGVHIGSFTQDIDKVTCNLCLEVAKAKESRNGSAAPDSE